MFYAQEPIRDKLDVHVFELGFLERVFNNLQLLALKSKIEKEK